MSSWRDCIASVRTGRAAEWLKWFWWPEQRTCREICNAKINWFFLLSSAPNLLQCLPSLCLPLFDRIHEEELKSPSHFVLSVNGHRTRDRSWVRWILFIINLRLSFIVRVPVHYLKVSLRLKVSRNFSFPTILCFSAFFGSFHATFTLTTWIFFIHKSSWWKIAHF